MNTTFKQVLAYCQVQKINLSAQQELILMIISQATSAVSSHEILTNLIQHNPKANRMTIHRALDLLIKANLIHKIQVNQTYSLCQHLSDHSCQLFICLKCAKQIEVHSHQICQPLNQASNEHSFTLANPLEITGYCAQCRSL